MGWIDAASNEVLVEVHSEYFRPAEVDFLLGDASKAMNNLGWRHKTPLDELVREMMDADLKIIDLRKRGLEPHR